MKSTRRVTTVAALLLVALPCVSAEPPRHYFTGRVCRGSKTSFQPGDVPCEHPLRGVAVTLKNSRGIIVRSRTDADGRYSVEPIRLYGTDDDIVMFEARHFVILKIGPVTCASDTSLERGVGLTVFLQRQRTAKEKVTLY